MESEDEVRRYYPDAEFMPGDPPPIGETLIDTQLPAESKWAPIVVLGAVKVGDMQDHIHAYDCPTCTCSAPHPFEGWWIVRSIFQPVDGTHFVSTLAYPPRLKRIKGNQAGNL